MQNANNLSEYKEHHKNKQLLKFIWENKFDFWLLNEIGLNWSRIDACNSFYERIIEFFKPVKYKVAFNENEKDLEDKYQYGGTGVMATERMTCKVIKKGKDTTGLGRWVWVLIEGKERKKLRIVSAYRPSETNNGEKSVMQQHFRYYTKTGRTDKEGNVVNPRKAFYED